MQTAYIFRGYYVSKQPTSDISFVRIAEALSWLRKGDLRRPRAKQETKLAFKNVNLIYWFAVNLL